MLMLLLLLLLLTDDEEGGWPRTWAGGKILTYSAQNFSTVVGHIGRASHDTKAHRRELSSTTIGRRIGPGRYRWALSSRGCGCRTRHVHSHEGVALGCWDLRLAMRYEAPSPKSLIELLVCAQLFGLGARGWKADWLLLGASLQRAVLAARHEKGLDVSQ